ncbi:tRNA (adenosine(37)-N6)-threonylcarbamoyltransferase complex dimerization subunit type 1 TsaB [Sphingomonas sp. KRR8]|uniref:tRNA (adenosine(37)-N6)-threonylcarbamoyltransferase complex dimerization subunit type 1 TsaB n=1 Tax=Sphingomonas sp. KRR8 TaxID=2942996 RepID=UPI002020421F|nr:tRNA (adenosine(37)-N6)-threonylcarbamoyltransferase complex dimerization subunit type 1 TsaB [Sphingomonas sp. KRR8]URD61004.1 tRNA (adenosine(37)-N6)-threonylcarbamoyltransferase complex dimerization subunit type 1 TsaB [Sphingomonas sp. KRR8]
MILALDTSTAACTAALFKADGALLARADQVIGRGHAERLVPMIGDLLAGRQPDRVLVGCGPGSFTGLRVAIAAAHGMAIGWGAPLRGFNSLALLAAGAPGDGPVAVAVTGGHGELFVQQFTRGGLLAADGPLLNLRPEQAAAEISAPLVVGSGAEALIAARGRGDALDLLPAAADALELPPALTSLDPRPIYARAPDARPKAA